jgi:hypothetical protein
MCHQDNVMDIQAPRGLSGKAGILEGIPAFFLKDKFVWFYVAGQCRGSHEARFRGSTSRAARQDEPARTPRVEKRNAT